MKLVNQLAEFVVQSSFEKLSKFAIRELKSRILDAVGCAIGALEGDPIRMIREQLKDFGGNERCSLIGEGKTAPDRAAFYNGALVRYLDFNDSYLGKGETCHPSDNVGPVLAACEYADVTGKDFLTALAVAYQVQCRLSDVAPVRHKGFDHTTQGAYAVAAGVSKALKLNADRTANALAISGTAFNALRVTRTGSLSHWKGLAYPNTAWGATHSAFLAMRGITGPPEVFEGNKGFMDAIAGKFEIDWSKENLEKVTKTIIKKFNAEIHSQSAAEGALELKKQHGIQPTDIRKIDIDIFDVAYHIIGGGEEGEKTRIQTKEEADHSLPYIVAVALLDNTVMPSQYRMDRIARDDVQHLLRKVNIAPSEEYSRRFPDEVACRIKIKLNDGTDFEIEKKDYEGFFTRPMNWNTLIEKFTSLSEAYVDEQLREKIIDTVANIENKKVSELTDLLRQIRYSRS